MILILKLNLTSLRNICTLKVVFVEHHTQFNVINVSQDSKSNWTQAGSFTNNLVEIKLVFIKLK